MNRARPKAVVSRARGAVVAQRDLDWKVLAAAWSITYEQCGDVEVALRRTFEAARTGFAPTCPGDDVIAAVARRHNVTVDALVFGGREHAGVRFEAFFLLALRKTPEQEIARLFQVDRRTVARGRRSFERELASRAELRAQVGWLVNTLDRKAAL